IRMTSHITIRSFLFHFIKCIPRPLVLPARIDPIVRNVIIAQKAKVDRDNQRAKRKMFKSVFLIYNIVNDEESGDSRITLESITEEERETVHEYLIDFIRFLYEDDAMFCEPKQIREILTGLIYYRMEILPIFTELLKEIGKELPLSLSFIASIEDKVRNEMWRLSETGEIEEFEASVDRRGRAKLRRMMNDIEQLFKDDVDMEYYYFAEASDHAWFRENWREGMKSIGNISEEYSLED
ncbi:hypothetical protein PFISCL1PPCAC_24058, partial [Pristionchus fissidentatus]